MSTARGDVREVRITEVVVQGGRRPEGEIDELARSIERLGLLHPIVLTPKKVLVAGLHRLAACKSLGWKTIRASIVALDELTSELAQIDENLVRNELTVLERAEQIARRKNIYEALHPETKQYKAGGTAKSARARGEPANVKLSFARDAAFKTRVSPRTIERSVQIVSSIPRDLRDRLKKTVIADSRTDLMLLARMAPSEQRAVVDRLSRGDARTVRRAVIANIAEGIDRKARTPKGTYDVIVVDPPWPGDVGRSLYPVMSLEEIQALPVAKLAGSNCVLWLWAVNAQLRHAYPCLDAWGFQERAVLTWVKNRVGTGSWLRNRTEHCILAVKGSPVVTLSNQTTVLAADLREHSRKPDEFYTLVESLCPGAKLEMFAREPRKGWRSWGAEEERFGSEPRRAIGGRRA